MANEQAPLKSAVESPAFGRFAWFIYGAAASGLIVGLIVRGVVVDGARDELEAVREVSRLSDAVHESASESMTAALVDCQTSRRRAGGDDWFCGRTSSGAYSCWQDRKECEEKWGACVAQGGAECFDAKDPAGVEYSYCYSDGPTCLAQRGQIKASGQREMTSSCRFEP